MRRALLCFLILAALGLAPRCAHAEDVELAPGVAVDLRRRAASAELERLVERLDRDTRRRLVGVYAAFDDSPSDVSSMAGCDDDGDYVVVLSDALLRLAGFVAEAEAIDEVFGTHEVDRYARFLAEAAGSSAYASGVRPVPPPSGFFGALPRGSLAQRAFQDRIAGVRFGEILAAVLAHELQHLVQGDLVCPHPTPTHERGDDQWTPEERDRALAVALRVYGRESVLGVDAAATTSLLEAGWTERGGLAWLAVMERMESASRVASTYLRLHADSAARGAVARASAEAWRLLRAAPPSVSRPWGREDYSAPFDAHRE